ncbi:Arf family guanine nucleotide exchange factor SEC7 [Aspergillus luchuensis]|uniref:Guanine nucleotide exchange protein for ADP-robosylation factor n=1 Tax=Aspergillus kawachii TaxID=1069201 RepID=A0A7R7W1Y0_ASPKA|nr:guanine nucleotide exchange protein for ADP-robosylation factor [Aspergillus luchuensis]BCR94889.1 guanine nucleotide exchange protein for ADP-robosylation factor [Aspergillus luchuensis]BCS07466.1 guanine nucleotide exchange protein for ADP-robosylation factor [Aspergillus luchuensis]GAA86093.1 guanyl-nucleotide exchange factor [Aspergillus luchuensis IFO 4308]
MAEVENGSVNEPPTQTSTTLPPVDNKEDVAGDVLAHTESPVDGDKPAPPEVSDSQGIDAQESEEAHSSPEQLETAENTESPGQAPSSPEEAVASSEPKADTEPESTSKPDTQDQPADTSPVVPAVNVEEESSADKQDVASIPHQDEIPSDSRMRSDSRSTTATFATHRSVTVSSTVFIVTALDTIGASKEARRSKELEDAVKSALANVKQSDGQPIDPELIFRPLQLATKTFSIPLQVTALDCIGKLITYSYFAFPSSQDGKTPESEANPEQPPLIERAIDAICDCFENEATPVEIQQQIIKSLLAAVLNDKIVVHGAGLLKAVRQIYNIFIYSKSSQNQQIAQGSLTQMVSTVFDRVQVRLDLKELRLRDGEKGQTGSSDAVTLETADTPQATEDDHDSDAPSAVASDQPVTKEPVEKLTLQSFESNKDVTSVNDNAPTMVTRARGNQRSARSMSAASAEDIDGTSDDDEDEIYVKDAFLVFRALCKLSHKILSHDQQQDLKSQNMRSKLLSLHLIHYLINNHVVTFTSPLLTIKISSNSPDAMTLLQAVRPHLCLSLSRNGSSSVPRVFEVCCEIFWLMLKDMRVMMKKELEVFLKEIYLTILEKRNSPLFQKQYFMEILERLAGDPRALVEMYLNYDCDRTALENIFQNIIEQLSRYASIPVTVTAFQQQQYQEHHVKVSTIGNDWHQRGTLPPNLTTASVANVHQPNLQHVPPDYILKNQAVECLVEILQSLDNWASQRLVDQAAPVLNSSSQKSIDNPRDSMETTAATYLSSPRIESTDGSTTPVAEDDPSQIEKVKQRKIAFTNAIQQFNFKAKRGIKLFIKDGFVRSSSPEDIAAFLFRNERLDKAMIGEYLGEGEPENIAIMHAFVDMMEFSKRRFVDALRQFLQHFRLPGEAQKIDRFMLKFAERYVTQNPNAFANADTAYVLAYSVIMLNTDQHSAKIKGRRMTKEDFIKNNRGINDNQDLPDDYLGSIYDEIANNEIVLDTEREHAANLGIPTSAPSGGLASRAGQVFATVGRDIQGEKYAQASEEMANKTEQLYRSLIRAQRKTAVKEALSRFIPATSVQHVGSMFNVTWMSFLSGLSAPMQDTQYLEIIRLCMGGMKLAIRISCAFELETPRVAFVTALAKFTNLGNVREMVAKNVEALKALLDVALTEGNHLKGSWREILTCVSQLDRLQLLTDGVDEGSLPDVSRARIVTQPSTDGSRKSMQASRRPRPRSINGPTAFRTEVAMESRSAEMIRGVDRIFTNTANLSHEAIIDFIKALSEVSWQEIQSSGQTESPRTYSLQKLVEISYYNMTRVRIEWSKIWEVLGQHFNHVGCHSNTTVVFFALDSLRQLSMRFMEIEELPGFKFQKDFLKPFEHVMANSNAVTVKDMILRCLIQMIQARGDNIRSGWKTMFGVFTVAAREPYEGIVNMAFEHVTQIYNTRFGVVITQGAFPDLVVCLTEFSKNSKFQKKSLQAIETLKSTVTKMLRTPECPLSHRGASPEGFHEDATNLSQQLTRQSKEEQFWYPILIAFQDVLMTGDDLEVRSQALTYLFETLIRHGGEFPQEFWDVLWRQLLYPIFVVLQSKSEMSKVPNHEELSVWLSTTMIQALRNMITLFTHYFDALEYMLGRILELLTLCICQENDTIARIGSNCLQQLILQNVTKFQLEHWKKVVGAFVELFSKTTAYELFTAAASISSKSPGSLKPANGESASNEESGQESSETASDQEHVAEAQKANGTQNVTSEHEEGDMPAASTPALEDYRPQADAQQQPAAVTVARRRFFNRIITNCVLQLLMIETVHELFSNDKVYAQIPSHELLRLMGLLKKSYQFAKKFNEDKELRMQLWRQGFMKQPPNLLKQESGSAATYVHILFRMYHDEREERRSSRAETEAALIPLCADIIRSFVRLDEDSQHRNVVAWRPVVVDVLEGYTNFPSDGFDKHIGTFYPLAVDLLARDLNPEIRISLQSLLRRIGEAKLGIPVGQTSLQSGHRNSVSSQYSRKHSGGH